MYFLTSDIIKYLPEKEIYFLEKIISFLLIQKFNFDIYFFNEKYFMNFKYEYFKDLNIINIFEYFDIRSHSWYKIFIFSCKVLLNIYKILIFQYCNFIFDLKKIFWIYIYRSYFDFWNYSIYQIFSGKNITYLYYNYYFQYKKYNYISLTIIFLDYENRK